MAGTIRTRAVTAGFANLNERLEPLKAALENRLTALWFCHEALADEFPDQYVRKQYHQLNKYFAWCAYCVPDK